MKNFNDSCDKPITLITHSGSFHYDELLATAFLMELFDDVILLRTRDPKIIKTGTIVYDVGFEFDPANKRFDHHMKWFSEVFSEDYNVKLSSAGLIYKYYHEAVFKKYGLHSNDILIFNYIKNKMYKELFLATDAIDNGIEITYSIKPRTIQDIIKLFNTSYIDDMDEYNAAQDSQFHKVLEFVKMDLKNYLNNLFNNFLPGFRKAIDFLQNNKDPDIVVITDNYISISAIVEAERFTSRDLKYMIFKKNNEYRIYCFNIPEHDFQPKVPLKQEWRGKSQEELKTISQIPGIRFVHATGFTGSVDTLDSAIMMCHESLKVYK